MLKEGTLEVGNLLDKTKDSEAYQKAFNKTIDEGIESVKNYDNTLTDLENRLKTLSSTRSDIESLTKILSNLNEGNLTASDMEQLISISEEFLPYLNDEITLREKLNEVIDESKSVYKSTYEYMALLSSDTYKTLTIRIENLFQRFRRCLHR